ncbi:MAG: hypothetical protein ACT4OZ_17690 [Gemmatimonadota bacterium]
MRVWARRCLLLFVVATQLDAQSRAGSRILGTRSAALAASVEYVDFGDGLAEGNFIADEAARVTRLRQFNLPLSAASALPGDWRLDVTSMFAGGQVTYIDSAGRERHADLSGLSDVRVRATGRVFNDAIRLTAGFNLPSGRTGLSPDEFSSLRILASPALGLGSTPVGAGPSGTLGLVMARPAGPWYIAFGASYEHRGSYQPLAAIAAGAPSADFRPGGVVRGSVGVDRLVGQHQVAMTVAADFFFEDRLRGELAGSSGESEIARVRLGPVVSADTRLNLAVPRFRELIAYTSFLLRTAFSRDGQRAEGSSGHYLESGVRGVLPLPILLASATVVNHDLVVTAGARWHSGLRLTQGLPTAGVESLNASIGTSHNFGLLQVQPFARVQGGRLRDRGTAGAASLPFSGLAVGILFLSRF